MDDDVVLTPLFFNGAVQVADAFQLLDGLFNCSVLFAYRGHQSQSFTDARKRDRHRTGGKAFDEGIDRLGGFLLR